VATPAPRHDAIRDWQTPRCLRRDPSVVDPPLKLLIGTDESGVF